MTGRVATPDATVVLLPRFVDAATADGVWILFGSSAHQRGQGSGADRTWLDAAGLRGWRRNHPVPAGGGETVEVDFAWPLARVALEASPFFTHGSLVKQERDMGRRRLLVVNGWRVVEATDPDLENQRAFGSSVAASRVVLDC